MFAGARLVGVERRVGRLAVLHVDPDEHAALRSGGDPRDVPAEDVVADVEGDPRRLDRDAAVEVLGVDSLDRFDVRGRVGVAAVVVVLAEQVEGALDAIVYRRDAGERRRGRLAGDEVVRDRGVIVIRRGRRPFT
ncbi:hypothetical protein BRD03_05145 [Halobacteriales archaeon QS_9_68_17]|nr:MAG: hypothetical protein BRD03_05145 [Halobacteriales archaeon QS_9_68_17]